MLGLLDSTGSDGDLPDAVSVDSDRGDVAGVVYGYGRCRRGSVAIVVARLVCAWTLNDTDYKD
jgi:hypothetical protein